jgi:hypothetical protein
VYSQHQLGPGAPDCPVAHRTVTGGAPDSIRCPRLVDGEPAALGKRWGCTTIIHRTVWWCTGLSDESSATNSSLSKKEKCDVAKIHRTVLWANCASVNGRPCNQRTTRGSLQRSVGCTGLSGAPTSLEEQRSDAPNLEGDRAPDCYSSCPVVHQTVWCTTRQKARLAFQDWSPTAPSCLGAIKGTPRRMEHYTKLTRNIIRLLDFGSMHLIRCVSDLSSIWVADFVCCVLSSSLDLCAWLWCRFESCVCCSPILTLVLLCDLYCKGERLQIMEIPRNRENTLKEKIVVFKSIIGSLERGWVQP